MNLGHINIGTGPSTGDGDPLRTAFAIINQNFTDIQGNISGTGGTVTSVAGRSGNITLTTQDIIGFNNLNFANIASVNAATSFTMANVAQWHGNVTTVSAAINQLAARLTAASL